MNLQAAGRAAAHRHAGLLFAFGAALLFSLKPVLVKLIYTYELETITLLAWRMLISMPIYLAIGLLLVQRARRSGQTFKRRWVARALLVGLIGYYLAALFDLLGLQTITAQLERLILFTYPAWVAVLSWLLLRSPLTARIVLALGLSYLGIAVIFLSDWQQLGPGVIIGTLWVLASALSFSLYVVLSKPVIDQLGGNAFTVLAMLASGVFTLIHFFAVSSPGALLIPMPALWLVFAMAVFCTVVPSFMLAAAISRLGPSKTAITGTLGPAMTSVFAVILLDELFGWPQAIGLLLVVIAIAVMQARPRPNAP